MSSDEDVRGRMRPHASIARKPSPGVAARMKMLEADAEKRNAAHSARVAYQRLSPSPSPHRSRSRPRTTSSDNSSDMSGVSSAIDVPTSIPTSVITTGGMGAATGVKLALEKDLPPTPVDDEATLLQHDSRSSDSSSSDPSESYADENGTTASAPASPQQTSTSIETSGRTPQAQPQPYTGPYASEGGLQRRSSVISLSRISFAAQLSRLTSLSLPLSEELSDRIRNLATAAEMCDALTGAGKQIGRWIDTAKKVLKGLDADDDVEWAAQGRESLNEVDAAVARFSTLMNVYVELIDELHNRPDTEDADKGVLVEIIEAMEATVTGWDEVQTLLTGVRTQVEIAMEWNELWTTVLQEIQAELEACQTLVFEMEEKRHRAMMEDSGSVDIDTLETIMEEAPGPTFPVVSVQSGKPAEELEAENRALLGLFARMQPLRASLDFLPMTLQGFQMRAEHIFPSACEDLESRKKVLEKKWARLNADAEGLKKELGEDRWVTIFRNAGKQATAMIDSVERSMNKLKEAIIVWEDSNFRADTDIRKKMENYEAKKMHYGAAIQRTFAIISKGINDRFTVNGEIIRLNTYMRSRWQKLEASIADLDHTISDLQLDTQALRDSISSLNSLEIGSGLVTPGSSPASSVVLSASPGTSTSERNKLTSSVRRPSSAASTPRPSPNSARHSLIPQRSPYARLSSSGSVASVPRGSVSPVPSMSRSSTVPNAPSSCSSSSSSSRKPGSVSNRPRWNTSTKTDDGTFGHNFKPATLTMPSPYRKGATTPSASSSRRGSTSSGTRIPVPSPLSIADTPSPTSPHFSRRSGQYLSPSPSPATARPLLRTQASMSNLAARSAAQRPSSRIAAPRPESRTYYGRSESRNGYGYNGQRNDSRAGDRPTIQVRAASAMAGSHGSKRSSFLPQPRATTPSGTGKRNSVAGVRPAEKPRWR